MNRETNQEFPSTRENIERADGNAPYISPTPGEIPIAAMAPLDPNKVIVIDDNTPPGAELFTKEDVETVRECGFNVGMRQISHYWGVLKKYIELFEGTGVAFMPEVPYYFSPKNAFNEEALGSYLTEFKKYSGIAAWNFVDEPLYAELDIVKERYDFARSKDPNHMFYINLVSSGSAAKFIGDYTNIPKDEAYKKYLDKFQEMFKPAVWSYDMYPIRTTVTGSITVDVGTFYKDLGFFRDMSKKTGRPFWAYCQSQALHYPSSLAGFPPPEEEYLRYEAFNALAFGAQGIVYWTYAQVKDSEVEINTTALYGTREDGTFGKTKYWYYAQKVNQEIKKFNKVFLGCNAVNVINISASFIGTKRVENFGPLTFGQAESGGAVFSQINNKTDKYVVIVNSSPLDACTLALQFDGKSPVVIWTPDTDKETVDSPSLKIPNPFPVGQYLKPGGYLIIKYNSK